MSKASTPTRFQGRWSVCGLCGRRGVVVTAAQWIVSGAGGVVIAALARFCFRARPAALAAAHDGVQKVRVRVKGGYSPD